MVQGGGEAEAVLQMQQAVHNELAAGGCQASRHNRCCDRLRLPCAYEKEGMWPPFPAAMHPLPLPSGVEVWLNGHHSTKFFIRFPLSLSLPSFLFSQGTLFPHLHLPQRRIILICQPLLLQQAAQLLPVQRLVVGARGICSTIRRYINRQYNCKAMCKGWQHRATALLFHMTAMLQPDAAHKTAATQPACLLSTVEP